MINKILVVDDDLAQRLLLRMNLEEDRFDVYEAADGREALQVLNNNGAIRLVLTDLMMPGFDGYDLIREIRAQEFQYSYIIVLTASENSEAKMKALALGADDYLTKPVSPEELKLRLQGGTRLLRLEGHEELVLAMAKLADYRSEETGFHLERVCRYTSLLGQDLAEHRPELGLCVHAAEEIARVSPLHDMGKVAISDAILHKPGRLTPAEFATMKTHTTIGGNLIREIHDRTGSPYLKFAKNVVMCHHERWDGTGYPAGLCGPAIPLCARIVALADVYDAMASKRCYKAASSHEEVKKEILAEKGRHFDPAVVEAFVRQEESWLNIKERFAD